MGTSCKDLAIAGIENWSGYYLDVFGEDVQVTVNIHEGGADPYDSQKYLNIYLAEQGIPNVDYRDDDWSNSSNRVVNMYNWDPRNPSPYTDEEYARTISHEMGHVFGICDGYPDNIDLTFLDRFFGITRRQDASALGLIGDDVMVRQFDKLNISSTDIGMLILAYNYDEFQVYADYSGYTQSRYFEQEGKE